MNFNLDTTRELEFNNEMVFAELAILRSRPNPSFSGPSGRSHVRERLGL